MTINWIALDWGTSRLRAFAMNGDGAVMDRRASDDGMGGLEADGFEPTLLSLIGDWLADAPPTFAAGMLGARGGWVEAPYASAPCAPLDPTLFSRAPAADPRLRVAIVHGVAQTSPPDVMRGEETQIAGFLSAHPSFDGALCLPGTHSKWVRVSAGEIVGFRTFMTGEMFALLANRSILSRSLDDGFDEGAFAEAAADGRSRPEQIASRLFSLRAEGLLTSPAPGMARARLSGWLIGMELAAAKGWWLGADVALIGAPDIAARYSAALAQEGVAAPVVNAEDASLAGLRVAKTLREAT
ncbi:MAG: 2-dehydro-3-deoxygalactonokinase [Pseudomonadota bacterium]